MQGKINFFKFIKFLSQQFYSVKENSRIKWMSLSQLSYLQFNFLNNVSCFTKHFIFQFVYSSGHCLKMLSQHCHPVVTSSFHFFVGIEIRHWFHYHSSSLFVALLLWRSLKDPILNVVSCYHKQLSNQLRLICSQTFGFVGQWVH